MRVKYYSKNTVQYSANMNYSLKNEAWISNTLAQCQQDLLFCIRLCRCRWYLSVEFMIILFFAKIFSTRDPDYSKLNNASNLNMKYDKRPRLSIGQSAIRSCLPFQWVSTLEARVTFKTSEVGLFNYCVLMIKWEQHNGLINFLITVSTKSNYNQIHRLVNHTSIKLKQSPLGSNRFQTEQMSRFSQSSTSSHGDVYLRAVAPTMQAKQRLFRATGKLWACQKT